MKHCDKHLLFFLPGNYFWKNWPMAKFTNLPDHIVFVPHEFANVISKEMSLYIVFVGWPFISFAWKC